MPAKVPSMTAGGVIRAGSAVGIDAAGRAIPAETLRMAGDPSQKTGFFGREFTVTDEFVATATDPYSLVDRRLEEVRQSLVGVVARAMHDGREYVIRYRDMGKVRDEMRMLTSYRMGVSITLLRFDDAEIGEHVHPDAHVPFEKRDEWKAGDRLSLLVHGKNGGAVGERMFVLSEYGWERIA